MDVTADQPHVQAPAPMVLPVWELLDEGQETTQLAQLWQWVLWMVDRHELGGKIQPCWAQHGPAVETLTALHQRWLEIYLRPGWGGIEGVMDAQSNRGYEALVWLEQLDTRVERLGRTFGRCVAGHQDKVIDVTDGWSHPLEYLGKLARTEALPVSG